MSNQLTKEQYNLKVGMLLKAIREEKKLSQKKLATALGLKTYATIIGYEKGDIAMPVYYIKRLSEVLGLDVRELLPSTVVA